MALGVGVPLALALAIGFGRSALRAESAHGDLPTISRIVGGSVAAAAAPAPQSLANLELTKISLTDTTVTAPLGEKKVAHLTIDPALQRVAEGVMSMHHVPEAAVVLMDTQTGKILVYASHLEKGPARDLCVEATAPAASVFKIITASALVEQTGATADQRECYSGGEQRIVEKDLVPDPKRDRWCTTLGGAMGRSINTVFARLALKHLKPAGLEEMAKSLGFGSTLPFDVAVQTSAERFPEDSLGFARTAAGFWNTTLSPVHAAWLSALMARGGEPVRPVLVADVAEEGKVIWNAPTGLAQKRAIKQTTAEAVTTMMETTVSDGTSYRAFHDPKGAAFLPNIGVAGKTGTLTDPTNQRFYTWFTGFAPSRPIVIADGDTPDSRPPRQVSIGVLVVNQPTWTIKANVLAREVLRAYFASQKAPNVTAPQLRQGAHGQTTEGDGEDAPQAQPSTTPGTKHRRHRGS
jgi:membrane peptidoglycan carboxypeptidase